MVGDFCAFVSALIFRFYDVMTARTLSPPCKVSLPDRSYPLYLPVPSYSANHGRLCSESGSIALLSSS